MADSTLNILIKLRDLTQAGITKLKKNFSAAAKAGEELEDVDVGETEKGVKGLNRELKNTEDQAADAAIEFNELRSSGLALAAIGTAIAAPFLAAAKAAGEFQTQIAEIETLVAPSARANEELRKSVVALSNEFGVDRARVAAALYQTISTGAEAGADANERLAIALTLARAGVADVETVTKGLASVLNAFNLEGTEAARVADSLFTTVKGGATTIDELSNFLFQAAPLANALSVDFTELNAAIQTITLSGTPTSVATTQIRAALQGLARDTPEVTEALGEFGSVSEAIAKQGLQKTFDQIRKAAKGSEAQMIKMLGSIEGVQAILQLTTAGGGPAERFTQALKDQEEAAGAAARAADIVQQSFGVQLETALTRISNAFTELGQAVIPILEPMVVGIGNLAVAFQQLLATSEVAQTIAQVTLALTALGVALTALFTTILVAGKGFTVLKLALTGFNRGLRLARINLARATTAVRVFTVASRAMLGPVGFIVTGLLLLSSTAVAFASDMDEVTEAVDDSIESFEALSELDKVKALDLAEGAVDQLNKELDEAKDKLEQLTLREDVGNPLQKLFTTESDIEDAQAEVDELEARIIEVGDKFDILKEKSEINIGNVDVSIEGIRSYFEQLDEAEIKVVALTGSIANMRAELEEPVTGFQIESVFGDESVISKAASAARSVIGGVQNILIENKVKELETEKEIIQVLAQKLTVAQQALFAEDLVTKDKESAAAAELSAAEKLAAAKTRVSITGAENRLAEAQARADVDAIRAGDEALTDDLQRQLDAREINEQEFADARSRIVLGQLEADKQLAALQLENARKLTDAKLAVIEAGIDRVKLAQDAASSSETATSSQATLNLADARKQQLELEFDTLETTITGRLTALGIRTEAQVKAIADDIAEGSIEGIERAFERLIANQDAQVALVTARLEAGAISQAVAQEKIADAARVTASALRDELIPAVEALLLLDPGDPALLRFLEELQLTLDNTTVELTEFQQGVKTLLEANLADFFEDLLNNFGSLSDAFEKFVQGVRKAILRLIAERLAKRLVDSLFSFLGSSEGGLISSPSTGGFIKAADGGVLKLASGGPSRNVAQLASGGLVSRIRELASGGPVSSTHTHTHTHTRARGGSVPKLEDGVPVKAAGAAGAAGLAEDGVSKLVGDRPEGSAHEPGGSVPHLARGGPVGSVPELEDSVPELARGGPGGSVRGPGTSTSDSIPAMLSDGEYVMKAASVRQYGVQMMEAINRGIAEPVDVSRRLSITKPPKRRFADGGSVGTSPTQAQLRAGASASGQQRAATQQPTELVLNVSDDALNSMMRDVLEREFGRILATR